MLDLLLRGAQPGGVDIPSLLATFERLACAQEDTARMLAREYGNPVDGVPAHSPARLPHIARIELAAAEVHTLDLEAALGKPCTRGHIVNLGDDPVDLRFVGMAGEQASSIYHLPPGNVLDLSWIVRRIEIRSDANAAADVQILAQ